MTLEELITRFREDADDETQPHLHDRSWVIGRLNDAVDEACLRGRLIHESAREDVCQIPLEVGVASYPLHRALYELDHIGYRATGELKRTKLTLVSTEALDALDCDWRDMPNDRPACAIQTDRSIRLVPAPKAAGSLFLEGYRLPMSPMAQGSDEPEINRAHHRYLVQWALWCAFSKPDVDYYDMDRARAAEAEFTRYFGPRPDADLRRMTREDAPHHVEPFFI